MVKYVKIIKLIENLRIEKNRQVLRKCLINLLLNDGLGLEQLPMIVMITHCGRRHQLLLVSADIQSIECLTLKTIC